MPCVRRPRPRPRRTPRDCRWPGTPRTRSTRRTPQAERRKLGGSRRSGSGIRVPQGRRGTRTRARSRRLLRGLRTRAAVVAARKQGCARRTPRPFPHLRSPRATGAVPSGPRFRGAALLRLPTCSRETGGRGALRHAERRKPQYPGGSGACLEVARGLLRELQRGSGYRLVRRLQGTILLDVRTVRVFPPGPTPGVSGMWVDRTETAEQRLLPDLRSRRPCLSYGRAWNSAATGVCAW